MAKSEWLEKIKRLLCSKQSGLVLDLSDANAVLARIVEILKENRGEINLPDIELEALLSLIHI